MPKSKYSKGAKKALAAMKKRYGAKKGEQVFYGKANKSGRGKSMLSKVNSVYKKGGHAGGKRKTKRSKRK